MDALKKEVINKAEKQNLMLNEQSLEFVNIGLDFQVAFGTDSEGNNWVLRLPRREDAFLKTKQEKDILDLVSQADTNFEVPKWDIYTNDLIGYEKLDGVPAVTTDSETQATNWLFDVENVPERFTQSLGKALASLHSVPKEKATEEGLIVQEPTELRDIMRKRMKAVKEKYEINEKLWARWQRWLEDEDMWPEKTGFIHGDLYPGHTLVDEDFSVTGIIDWTEAKVTDTANDFTAHFLVFGEQELDNLIRAYQEAGGYIWPKMKEHIIELLSTQGVTLSEFAESSGLKEYEEAAQEMLKNGST